MEFFSSEEFWTMCEKMVLDKGIVVDRPQGSRHPKYPDLVYPIDYGFVQNTESMDHGGIDIWIGTDIKKKIVGCIVTIDSIKNDSEIKLLYCCTDEEVARVWEIHNRSPFMKGLLIKRK